MSNISKHTGENIGGIVPLYWVFASDVLTMSLSKSTLQAAITLVDGAKWNSFYGTPDTIELENEESEKPAGLQYSYKLKCQVPQDRSSVETILRQMTGRGLIIWAKDKNGIARLFGTPENPMKKIGKLKKPATVEGFNGWEIVFTGDFPLPAFYAEDIPDSLKSTT